MFDTPIRLLLDKATEVAAAEVLDLVRSDDLTAGYVALRRTIDRLEAEAQRRLAAIDQRVAYSEHGYTSPTAFVKHTTRTTGGKARQAVVAARGARHMPLATKLHEAGEIGPDQLRVLRYAYETQPDAYPEAEPMLCDLARQLEWVADLRRAVEYWSQAVAEPPAADGRYARRYLYASRTLDGMVKVDALFDPEGGEIVLDRLLAATPPVADGDARTPAQRRADALIDLINGGPGGEPGAGYRANRAHLQVHVSYGTLRDLSPSLSETTSGHVLTPRAIRRISCDASINRIVFGPDSEPLEMGRRVRMPPEPLRRAVVARDRHCQFSGCDRPHWWCDVHHVDHWADGGTTNLDNLRLYCRHHHRLLHEGAWKPNRSPRGPKRAARTGDPP